MKCCQVSVRLGTRKKNPYAYPQKLGMGTADGIAYPKYMGNERQFSIYIRLIVMGINDYYDRNKLLRMVSGIFGEKKRRKKELNECVALWELVDNTTDSKVLSELSVSKYLEVREAVAYNPNIPLCEIENLCNDKSKLVRDAVARRRNRA